MKDEGYNMDLHIGCSGWSYRHWQGFFYPETLSHQQWFKYYTTHFNTVELNYSFYRFPTPATAKRWYEQAPEGFRYSLKVNRIITHLKQMQGTKRLVDDFYALGEILGEKMGCFLFQFPPTFHYTPEHLQQLLAQLDPQFRNVVEFRHNSWWQEEVYRELKKNKISFCSISYPELPETLIDTSDYVYLRFHGRNPKYSENYEEIELVQWINRFSQIKPQSTWIYFNNDYQGLAPNNALLMHRLLEKRIAHLP